MISVRSLTKRYGKIKALNSVDADFRDGEITAIVGENGAGKSTLLKICANILRADSGTLTVDGIDVKGDSVEVRKRIGYLPEMPYLYERLSGREFLYYIAEIRELKDYERIIEELAERIGISYFLDYEIGTYSKGMKQKISVISAIMHSPRNLLLDEPVYGLDPLTSRSLQRFIKGGKGTTVIATHSTDLVEHLADRVYMMRRGRFVFSGRTADIIRRYGGVENAYFSIME